MKLSDVLKEETVALTPGNYLVVITSAWGYVPTHKDTSAVQSGRHLYKIVKPEGSGETDINIVPVKPSEDTKTQSADETSPVVSVSGDTLMYVTGINDENARDVYHGIKHHVKEKIEVGEEHREAIMAFIDFANSQYSHGVNEFQVTTPEELEG